MNKAFSLTELVIVIAILGIVAAIVLPYFRSETTEAKEAAAKDNLRILRGVIQLYAARHSGVGPGYVDGTPSGDLDSDYFVEQVIVEGEGLRSMPANPFNNLETILMIGNSDAFPASATGQYGWIYQAATKTICLDWPGTDTDGVSYLDY